MLDNYNKLKYNNQLLYIDIIKQQSNNFTYDYDFIIKKKK